MITIKSSENSTTVANEREKGREYSKDMSGTHVIEMMAVTTTAVSVFIQSTEATAGRMTRVAQAPTKNHVIVRSLGPGTTPVSVTGIILQRQKSEYLLRSQITAKNAKRDTREGRKR